jgi:hypothetical protein
MLLPALVALVALLFAGSLARIYVSRRRPYQLVWILSLLLGALAGITFVLFLATDRNAGFFLVYYATGGLLMAAYLGLGSVYLFAPRRVAHATAGVIVALSVVGLGFLLSAPIHTTALHAANVEAGTKIVTGPSIAFIAILNTFGAAAVIGGAMYSAWRLYNRQGPARLLVANALIAAGTILAALAGTLARVASDGTYFWALLLVGFVVLFVGFNLTTSRVSGRS